MRFIQKNTLINLCCLVVVGSVLTTPLAAQPSGTNDNAPLVTKDGIIKNAAGYIQDGQNIFRYDTYGDEAFWGDALQLHQAIQGARFGGVGPGVSPKTALALGLKVDSDALPASVLNALRHGQIDLDDVGVTLALLKSDAVVGVKGFFNLNGSLKSVGLTCAVCHSTVNDAIAPGVGRRLDGWANHDLNTGAIIGAAPNLTPIRNLLQIKYPTITDDAIRTVLNTWGPGKFDAQLLFDGKTVGPNGPAATLIPNAFGLLGYNLHTWTGGWGTVTYWNALVAVLEMRGKGNFFDARLDDTNRWPIAATARFGHTSVAPADDQVTSKLPALQYYQLSLPAPKPTADLDFNAAAAARGQAIFSGKANCARCHVAPLWTEPGWNEHLPSEMKIDSFQADRSPDGAYKTMGLAGLYIRENGLFMKAENKGRFYHDGRFSTLLDVVNSYNSRFDLGLTSQESLDLVEYLKSL
jgi:mono/diheme cytochrome c family protein